MLDTAKISISKKNLSCEDVIANLLKANINCSITKNITLIDGKIESGCKITTTISSENDVRKVWDISKNQFDLTCAHLETSNYEGCILGFLHKRSCPTLSNWKNILKLPSLNFNLK